MEIYKGIKDFITNVATLGFKFDALINNGALGCDFGEKIPTSQLAKDTLEINVVGTIQLTDGILPLLKDTGRVINVSSKLAALRFQAKEIAEKFNNTNLSIEEINLAIEKYIEGCNKKDLEGFYQSVYGTSKMMLNAWSRFILA